MWNLEEGQGEVIFSARRCVAANWDMRATQCRQCSLHGMLHQVDPRSPPSHYRPQKLATTPSRDLVIYPLSLSRYFLTTHTILFMLICFVSCIPSSLFYFAQWRGT
eukprot:TRINITY_DN15979_c0_g1_i1.p2 TRINITY_DN15979_c0_g1~~TRINITY_DN15979_c0_g1_i1.p2  ORF type:complete len:106 (-),score=7.60 TRINITY_DN15979_c0_g1_i1:12-329(-)